MTTAGNGYNGWPNKATWAVYTWITNDQATHGAALEAMQQAEFPEDALRDYVEEELLGEILGAEASLATELIGIALADVDWREVAKALME